MITQSINLNLIPGAVPPRIKVSQYDYGSRTLRFTLYNGTTTFTQAGLSARIQGTKPDGKGFSYDATYGSGIVTADITRQMTACAGAVTCELVIVNEELDEELGTGNFIIDVEAAALSEDTDISETEIPAIIDAAEANAERAEAAAESAEAASAHAPYIGDNEHWYVWDSDDEQYVDSGVDAEGVDGVGIVSIAKTSTVGLVDTYTITLSNGNTSTFTVTNGAEATLPSGGTAGQALIKNSSTASDASWKDISTTGAIKWPQAEGYVGKNRIKNILSSTSKNNVTCTVNSDGSITLTTGSGGASANTWFNINTALSMGLEQGKSYIFNGAPSDSGTLLAIDKVGKLENGTTSISFTYNGNFQASDNIYFGCYSGTELNGVTFYPMVMDASIPDRTYAPYVPSNAELEAQVDWIYEKTTLFNISSDPTWAPANPTAKGLYAYKVGSIVCIYGYINPSANIAVWGNILTGFPHALTNGISSDHKNGAMFQLSSTGSSDKAKITCATALTAGTQYYFNFTYVTNE